MNFGIFSCMLYIFDVAEKQKGNITKKSSVLIAFFIKTYIAIFHHFHNTFRFSFIFISHVRFDQLFVEKTFVIFVFEDFKKIACM